MITLSENITCDDICDVISRLKISKNEYAKLYNDFNIPPSIIEKYESNIQKNDSIVTIDGMSIKVGYGTTKITTVNGVTTITHS
jgi:hypothetical protein